MKPKDFSYRFYKTMKSIDFFYRNVGSVILLYPETDKAQKWITENITRTPWLDHDRIEIERGYFEEIGDAIVFDGLTIKGT